MTDGIVKFKITAEISLVMTEEESEWYRETGEAERERALVLTKTQLESDFHSIVAPGMAEANVVVTVEEVTE